MSEKIELKEVEIYCPFCSQKMELDEEVILNEVNTIAHKSCCGIKDAGTFEEILTKYPFFTEEPTLDD